MPDRFYFDGPLQPGEATLSGREAHHLAIVLRASPGQSIIVFNGDGYDYPAEILAADRKRVHLLVSAGVAVLREWPFRLEVAVAMPKGDRGDWLVEKLTELGATSLVPLVTERTVVRPSASRLANLRRAVIEASKQCGRARLMTIQEPRSWPSHVAENPGLTRVLAHPGGEAIGAVPGDVSLAIGPEGGFTDTEVAMAQSAGWRVIGLGPRLLRVETAALALTACLTS